MQKTQNSDESSHQNDSKSAWRAHPGGPDEPHPKVCRPSSPHWESELTILQQQRPKTKMASSENTPRDLPHISQINTLTILETFGKTFWELTRQKWKVVACLSSVYVWNYNATFQKSNFKPTVKHGGGSTMIWSYSGFSEPRQFRSLLEQPEGECSSTGSSVGFFSRTMSRSTAAKVIANAAVGVNGGPNSC